MRTTERRKSYENLSESVAAIWDEEEEAAGKGGEISLSEAAREPITPSGAGGAKCRVAK